jgi:hypothetical protein
MGLLSTSLILWLQTEYTGRRVHIAIVGGHLNYRAIGLPRFAKWSPTRSQPMGLVQDSLVEKARAPELLLLLFIHTVFTLTRV